MSKQKERKTGFTTPSHLEVKRIYDRTDLERLEDQGRPPPAAEYPFTRGIHETMYRGRLWTMRQYAGFGTAEETNRRFHFLLSQGTSGLSVAFDLPTQMGRDADHPLAGGEVGRVGVSISSVHDLELLLAGLPLEKVSISMTINATAAILLAMLLVAAERRGVPWSELRGTVQNDLLKEYIARGTYIFPPRHAMRITTDLIVFCNEHVPRWNTISISGYHMREAGCTAVQELAFTMANGIAYVEATHAAGLNVDEFAPRLAFFFNCHNDFLEEVAKFRAARRMWAKIMRERFKAQAAESLMLRFHTQTAGSSLTAQQPLNNVVRTTVQALAAVLGGTQSLHTNSYDEALGLPTEESAQLALRTQQILAHESGVADVVDPLGGSYLVEAWTARLEEEAQKIIAQVDRMGGMLGAIEAGFPQQELERAAYEYQTSLERGERIIVGMNQFVSTEDQAPLAQTLDPAGEAAQRSRLAKLRESRDEQKVQHALARIRETAKGSGNLLVPILDAVRVDATLGEISDELRGVLGEYHG